MEFPTEFQNQCIVLVQKLIDIKAARFLIIDPNMNKKGFVGFNVEHKMEEEYHKNLWHLDPMHYSRFENSDETVISSNTIMLHKNWLNSIFYQNFIKPYGYVHVADIFFRNHNKIVAVLTVLRDDDMPQFSEQDLKTLKKIQPFLEYSLNNIYLPARISERQYMVKTYDLTNRELDVLEYALTGADNKTMCKHIRMSLPTLRTHLQHIYQKVGVHSTSELIAKVLRELHHQTPVKNDA